MAEIGHNSAGALAKDQLRAIVERIENLEEEKRALSEGIKEVYAEAKGNGFDTKVLRKVVALRRQSHEERVEQQALIELYMEALGEFAGTPLGQAAVRRAASGLGKPVAITDEESAAGVFGAFEGRDGTRVTLGVGEDPDDIPANLDRRRKRA